MWKSSATNTKLSEWNLTERTSLCWSELPRTASAGAWPCWGWPFYLIVWLRQHCFGGEADFESELCVQSWMPIYFKPTQLTKKLNHVNKKLCQVELFANKTRMIPMSWTSGGTCVDSGKYVCMWWPLHGEDVWLRVPRPPLWAVSTQSKQKLKILKLDHLWTEVIVG
jgi:hypothetical protein